MNSTTPEFDSVVKALLKPVRKRKTDSSRPGPLVGRNASQRSGPSSGTRTQKTSKTPKR